MIEPEHPTEKYLEGRMDFHESQARWFNDHGQPELAVWARSLAETWRDKLEALKAKEK